MKVEILLSTYNGERFLESQLDSLLHQTYKDWVCIIRDDGSTDSTISIIEKYINNYPDHFRLLPDREHVGWKESFRRLIYQCQAEYAFFCDQDDIWNEYKIEVMLGCVKALELDGTVPVLCICDLYVIDGSGDRVFDSYWECKKEDTYDFWPDAVFYNPYPGMSMAMNRAFLDVIRPMPSEVPHDWWCTLNAVFLKGFYKIPIKLGYYRSHKGNVEGLKVLSWRLLLYYLRCINLPIKYVKESCRMIEYLINRGDLQRYDPNRLQEVLILYKILKRAPILRKIILLFSSHISPTSFLRKLGWFLFV